MSPAGYSGTPLFKKLGVRPGCRLTLIDAPRGWSVPDLPSGVEVVPESSARGVRAPAELIVAFYADLAGVRNRVPSLAERIHPHGAIWVAWPRRAGGHDSDIREQDIRDVALPVGLVDVKVAALDQDWSGLRVVWRKQLRRPSAATRG